MALSPQVVPVRIGDIDTSLRNFMISRQRKGDDLKNSIREFGVLDPPLLLKGKGGYEIVFGFNRIHAAMDAGYKEVKSRVVERLDQSLYLRELLLKVHRNEVGPIGRIRGLMILKKEFGIDGSELERIFNKGIKLPSEIAGNGDVIAAILALPDKLLAYLDSRDMHYKTIMRLSRLPSEAVDRIAAWVAATDISVSNCTKIVEMAGDIIRRDGDFSSVDDAELLAVPDANERERCLLSLIRKVRYPEYSVQRDKVEAVKLLLRRGGFLVDFPEFFEGDGFTVSFRVHRKESWDALKERIGSLDEKLVVELQNML